MPFCADEHDLSSSLEHLDAQQELSLSDDNLVKLRKILQENNLPLDNPVLIVEVLVEKQDVQEDERKTKRFYFTEEDLREVFGAYGEVKDVELFENDECAYVTFTDVVAAYCAQQVLNGYFLSMFGVYLQVKWMPAKAEQGNWTRSQNVGQISQGGDSEMVRN